MKKSIFFVFAMTIFTTAAFCQINADLQGPKAKNYKLWEDDTQQTADIIVANPTGERITGPTAKNQRPWQKKSNAKTYTAVAFPGTNKMTGAKAKNQKRWLAQNSSSNAVYVKDKTTINGSENTSSRQR